MATIDKKNMNYRIDFSRMTLIMTADFADKAYNPESTEYDILTRLKKDFPDLRVERKTHSKPTSYTTSKSKEKFYHNPYKGITFNNMKQFIKTVDDKNGTYMSEYDRVYSYALGMGKKRAHAIVAGWFVEQFPKYRTDPFYYYNNNNRPPIIPFNPKTVADGSHAELPPTGTEG